MWLNKPIATPSVDGVFSCMLVTLISRNHFTFYFALLYLRHAFLN